MEKKLCGSAHNLRGIRTFFKLLIFFAKYWVKNGLRFWQLNLLSQIDYRLYLSPTVARAEARAGHFMKVTLEQNFFCDVWNQCLKMQSKEDQ